MSNLFCKAKEIIEKQGWHQGNWATVREVRKTDKVLGDYTYNEFVTDGPVCLHGALYLAASNGKAPHPSYRDDGYDTPISKARKKLDNAGFTTNWNDAPTRTKDEVLGVLEKFCLEEGDHQHE